MVEGLNLALFVTEAVIYFSLMTALLHFRHRIGLGVFLTALGVMHFVETYLAAVFYVALPFGVVSPGSSIFFAGKLVMILMLYMKEDASTVRQPIYGLFLGNLVTVAVAQVLLLHAPVDLGNGQKVDISFLADMGVLMVWGTALLYLDSLGMILLYERLGRIMPRLVVTRLAISGIAVLSFDQIGFYALLNHLYDAPFSVFVGGWLAKMLAVALYATMFALYQRAFHDHGAVMSRRPIRDIFSDLTFRERYEDLLSRTGRDALTGVFDRSRMEIEVPRMIREDLRAGKAASLVIIDVDQFKDVNDRFGHQHGDEVLRSVAGALQGALRQGDLLFRYGGEEFVVLLPSTPHEAAVDVADRLRLAISGSVRNGAGEAMTASLGLATAPDDGTGFNGVLAQADDRLYEAKRSGRNKVVGNAG